MTPAGSAGAATTGSLLVVKRAPPAGPGLGQGCSDGVAHGGKARAARRLSPNGIDGVARGNEARAARRLGPGCIVMLILLRAFIWNHDI